MQWYAVQSLQWYIILSQSAPDQLEIFMSYVLMSPQHTDCSIEQEFDHVVNWSSENKLTINKTKTQEIIFYKSNKIAHKHDIPLIPGIARVEEVRLLGVILTSYLSWSRHIDSVLICASQRLYLINQLKYALGITGLSNIFRALVVSKMLYALTAFGIPQPV